MFIQVSVRLGYPTAIQLNHSQQSVFWPMVAMQFSNYLRIMLGYDIQNIF